MFRRLYYRQFYRVLVLILLVLSLILIQSFSIFAETPIPEGVSAPLFISPDNDQQLLHRLATELVQNRVVTNATIQDVYDCLVAGSYNMSVAELLLLCSSLLSSHLSGQSGMYIDQFLYLISQNTNNIYQLLNIGGDTHTIGNDIVNISRALYDGVFDGSAPDFYTMIKDINWQKKGTFSGLASSFIGSYLSNGSILQPGEYFAFYKIDYQFNADNGYYKFFIPINRSYMTASNIYDIQFVDSWNDNGVEYKHLDYTLSYDNSRGGYNLYVRNYTIDSYSGLFEVIKFKINVAMTYQTNNLDTNVYFVSDDNIDFHYLKLGFNSDDIRSLLKDNLPMLSSLFDSTNSIKNYLTTEQSSRLLNIHNYISNIKSNIADLKYMYADDDMIARKQAGQATENAALDAFSGQGSAAATSSDVGTFKDISGNLKSGLSTGADPSAIYGVMTNPNVFFGWFSRENYIYINTRHSMPDNDNRRLRSAPKGDDVIDFYSQNQLDVDYLLDFYKQGGDK